MTGPEAQAFEAKVAELLADDRPPGTSSAINMPQVAKWFVDVRTGLEADRPLWIGSSIRRARLNPHRPQPPPTNRPLRRLIERPITWTSSASSSPPLSSSDSSWSSGAVFGLGPAPAEAATIRPVPTSSSPTALAPSPVGSQTLSPKEPACPQAAKSCLTLRGRASSPC